jgi:cytochrome oxidase Cu insertion factor (SCO1/SenC/PrrC family)
MNGSALKYWLVLAAMLGTAYGMSKIWRNQKSQGDVPAHAAVEPVSRRPEIIVKPFELTDQAGKPFNTASLAGKVWVTSFFFTNCPAVCWRLNRVLADLQAEMPDSKVHFVSITCDPDNDTPEALAKYAAHFKADPTRWTFLTGKLDDLKAVGKQFWVSLDKAIHSDRVMVIDGAGKVRGDYRVTEPDEIGRLKKKLAQLATEEQEKPNSEVGPAE